MPDAASPARRLAPAAFAGIALLVVLLVLAAALRERAPAGPAAAAGDGMAGPAADAAGRVTRGPHPALAEAAGRGARLGPLPGSLQGTEPPGINVDADGRLVRDRNLRAAYEYFLSAMGEEELDTLRDRVAHYLSTTLPAGAAAEAWALFDDYLGYREALASVPDNGAATDPAAVRARLDQVSALRRERLGAEAAQGFFAQEEAYDTFTLDRLALERDTALAPEERAARVAALEATLPPELLAARRDSVAVSETAQAVAALREQGAGEAEVRRLREERLGAEAAERLARLDREEADWEMRYNQYREQRQLILNTAQAEQDREAQLQALRKRLFSDTEALRAEALDRIRAGKSAPSRQP